MIAIFSIILLFIDRCTIDFALKGLLAQAKLTA